MNNSNEKSPHEKFNSWITTVAAICAILGISILGGKALFEPEPDNPTQESSEVNANDENDQSKSSTVEPTDVPETEQNTTPVPNPVPVPTAEPQPIIQPTMRPLSTPEVTSEIDLGSFGEDSGFEKKSFQPKPDQGDDGQKTNDNTTNNSPDSFTQENEDIKETTDNTTNTLCQFEFESPGRFILTSKGDNSSNADGTIDIKNTSEEDGDSQGFLSYKYSDLVNNEESSEELISFISVTQGTYIVNFVNCSLDNVNFYFENNDDALKNNTEEKYEELVVPTNEYVKIEITKETPAKTFKASFTQGFKPLINFYSDNSAEKNLTLKILDENMSELQNIELNYVNSDGSHNVIGDFSFDEGKKYYIQISSVDSVELPQTCNLMISQLVGEDPLETNHQ